jgi:hypothetical protein
MLNNLNSDILINILNYVGFYHDYKNLKNTNKYYYNLLYNLTDAIYYIDDDYIHNNNCLLILNDYHNYYQNIFFNQIIIINNIKELFTFNLKNIKLLDINLYETNIYYENEYDIFNEEILEKLINLKYLNISESNINYLPHNLINIEYLNISDTKIKTIPRTYKKLKYLVCVPYYTNNLKYIPKNISLNLHYLELINICHKSIYLNSENLKFLETYEGEKNICNKTYIYLDNNIMKYNQHNNMMILYINNKKNNKINRNIDYINMIPKLYFYCFA